LPQPSKLMMRVRFPLPAPVKAFRSAMMGFPEWLKSDPVLNGRCFSQNCGVKILTFGFSAHPKASRQNPANRGGLLDEVPQIQIASLRRGFFC
ncbi:hypothetical protein, partial [Enterobacter sichuanensis]|uniref:hypothetical protein n=1 Tax=Enterobacter sichuanensis TaxID=2071710 RepID=UPI001F3138D3